MSREQKRGITLLVCGGRNYADGDAVTRTLDAVHAARDVWVLVHGAARGADTLARDWARRHAIPEFPYPANWDKHGAAAGPIRNRAMLRLERPDLVVAFPGGDGTADMVRAAHAAGVEVYEVGIDAAITEGR